jgi:hypothetical protein
MPFPYLDEPGFLLEVTSIRPEDVTVIETQYPGYTLRCLTRRSEWIRDRLRKRYGNNANTGNTLALWEAAGAVIPGTIIRWVTVLTTWDIYTRRGFNPQDPAQVALQDDVNRVYSEVKEAADSDTGLFDLPNPVTNDSGVTTGGPLGYAETSPYRWTNIQREQAEVEDFNDAFNR